MKKLIALLMIISFVTVNTAGAFAEQKVLDRGRISGRVERRDSDRRINVRRPDHQGERRLSNRSNAPERRSLENRASRRNDDFFKRDRPALRHDSGFYNRERPMSRGGSAFFNRGRYYNRRPMALYQPRSRFYGHSHRDSSLSALEFFGISAAIIAIASAASHAHCDY